MTEQLTNLITYYVINNVLYVIAKNDEGEYYGTEDIKKADIHTHKSRSEQEQEKLSAFSNKLKFDNYGVCNAMYIDAVKRRVLMLDL